jgi:HSP20 family protein
MANIVRWDPIRDMVSLREAMDRLFEESFVRPRGWTGTSEGAGTLALDVFEDENEVTVKASIPGIKPEDIDISVTGDVLTIKGETKEEKEEKQGNYHLRERRYGAFQRSITLPTQINADKANADFKNGVLTLALPKVEEVKPKSIQIKSK